MERIGELNSADLALATTPFPAARRAVGLTIWSIANQHLCNISGKKTLLINILPKSILLTNFRIFFLFQCRLSVPFQSLSNKPSHADAKLNCAILELTSSSSTKKLNLSIRKVKARPRGKSIERWMPHFQRATMVLLALPVRWEITGGLKGLFCRWIGMSVGCCLEGCSSTYSW